MNGMNGMSSDAGDITYHVGISGGKDRRRGEEMSERPIIFSGPMVRAILDGRKTQTRRVAKFQPDNPHTFGVSSIWGGGVRHSDPDYYSVHAATNVNGECVDKWIRCPYGKPGDRLWVRETWAAAVGREPIWYAADGDSPTWKGRTRPSIHMPRYASRITLELTDVRVERVQDITEEDALAEGIYNGAYDPGIGDGGKPGWCWEPPQYFGTATHAFAALWNTIHGGHGLAGTSWGENPWVWVLAFRRLEEG